MMGQFVVWDGTNVNTEEPLAQEKHMQLYPNPASDVVNLQGASDKESQIRIFDVQGKLHHQLTLPAFNGLIDLPVAHLPKGLFFVEWQTQEGRFTDKIILE